MKVITFEEFFGNKDVRAIDKVIGQIRKHKKAYRQLIVFVAVMILFTTPVFASGVNTKAIDKLGNRLLEIIRVIGYWIVIAKGSTEVIGKAAQGDVKGASKMLISYTGIFAILYLYPMLLDMVKEAFG